ncbi:hypothetical protein ASPBRDRAFT_406900 [Aspergillus brasiliensis CBS 101740]|uniref:Uncharacterized protein n=1 Tax=Aspergillus brasiliensis (strain CBS 101740 / IMI 381727 / IBT 21946) TaxID=767769 RepID=A0A1L9UXL4_ASPBC|nr:hypothetical protein ASPBRDRAFT_406900 [Aspergillus brasiliensis CBS 101740]
MASRRMVWNRDRQAASEGCRRMDSWCKSSGLVGLGRGTGSDPGKFAAESTHTPPALPSTENDPFESFPRSILYDAATFSGR